LKKNDVIDDVVGDHSGVARNFDWGEDPK